MTSLKLAKLELRRLLSGQPIVAIALAVVLLVPLLYGALYLWAFWDPYSRIDRLPVALVNEDVPTRSGDATISAGGDLAEELLRERTLGWRIMSSREASAALKDHRVYMALSIPRDFSETLASADTSRPARATLTVTENEADSMLASQIGARVFAEIRSAAAASASERYYDAMFVGVADMRHGMSEAADGASSLREGLSDATRGGAGLRDGLYSARSGAGALAAGLKRLDDGTAGLASGSSAAVDGADQLASKLALAGNGAATVGTGAKALATGTQRLTGGLSLLSAQGPALSDSGKRLAAGAATLDTGVKATAAAVGDATAATEHLASGASRVADALARYAAANPDAASDPDLAVALTTAGGVSSGLADLHGNLTGASPLVGRLLDGARDVDAGAAAISAGIDSYTAGVISSSNGAVALATGAGDLAAGATTLSSGVGLAAAGADRLADGVGKVADGATALRAGAADARAGASLLVSGIDALADGSTALASGLGDAETGSSELADGLTVGVAAIPNDAPALRTAKSSMMSDPVSLQTVKRTEVANYGTGFAPYFIPLALWVGALVTFFLVAPIPRRALASRASDVTVALSGFWPAALMGAAQAVVLLVVVEVGLGLRPAHPWAACGLAVLTAITFIALIQLMNAALGPAGKLTAVVLLMLQLTSAAGTFPIQMVPSFFKAIHGFLPMTYVVDGMRQAISGDLAVVGTSAVALAVFASIALLGTVLTVHRQRIWTMDRLHPSLTI